MTSLVWPYPIVQTPTESWYAFIAAKFSSLWAPDNLDCSLAKDCKAGVAPLDIFSNGFKIKSYDGALNGSDKHYVYMAFAANPFVSSAGVPTTAH